MSAIEDAIDGALESLFGEGIEGLGTGRGTECRPPARVFIGETEVPVVGDGDGNGGLNVQMRKTGASDLTATARFTIPYVWNDEDIIGSIGSIEVQERRHEQVVHTEQAHACRRDGLAVRPAERILVRP